MEQTHAPAFVPEIDGPRLTLQRDELRDLMLSAGEIGIWHTLLEIHRMTGYGEASISASLRNLRKPQFGSYLLEKRPRGDRSHGLWEYRLSQAVPAKQLELLDKTFCPPRTNLNATQNEETILAALRRSDGNEGARSEATASRSNNPGT